MEGGWGNGTCRVEPACNTYVWIPFCQKRKKKDGQKPKLEKGGAGGVDYLSCGAIW